MNTTTAPALTIAQRRVLAQVPDAPRARETRVIRDTMGLPPTTAASAQVRKVLADLLAAGLVTRVGRSHWQRTTQS